ncbi:hypothetical protein HpDR59_11430 [Helicobacter pylori]
MRLLLVIIVLMAFATPRHYTKILALAQARVKSMVASVFFVFFLHLIKIPL